MRVDLIKHNGHKCNLSVSFKDENEECKFLYSLLTWFEKTLPVNCILPEADVECIVYDKHFDEGKYYISNCSTTALAFKFELNLIEIQQVIRDWRNYATGAMFAVGVVDDNVKYDNLNRIKTLKNLPVVIIKNSDLRIYLDIHQYYIGDLPYLLNRV